MVQFLVLGAGIFMLFGIIGDRKQFQPEEIVVSAGQIERMSQAWRKTRMRPPTQHELEGLIRDYIQEEVYYREAITLGLDQDNSVIRRHLRQKMEFLSADIAAQQDPDDADLREYLENHREKFTEDSKLSFRHIYFNRDSRGDLALSDAQATLASLNGSETAADIDAMGDSLMLPGSFESTRERDIANSFGRIFAQQLVNLDTDQWLGPVESGFGLHLVFISERAEAFVPAFESIRGQVEMEWREAKKQEVDAAFYEGLRARYSVVIDRPDWLEALLNIEGVIQR